MTNFKTLFYSLKLKQEKIMLANIASAIIDDEANNQITLAFFDGSIVQNDKPLNIPAKLCLADSVRFIESLAPDLLEGLIDYLKPEKRAEFVSGAVKVKYTFSDESDFICQ